MPSSKTTAGGSVKTCGPTAAMASLIQALQRLQRARRGRFRGWPDRRMGWPRAIRAASRRCSIVQMPSRAYLKKPCCVRTCRTAFMVDLRFFERAEIKDSLAYLRLISSRGDDLFLRAHCEICRRAASAAAHGRTQSASTRAANATFALGFCPNPCRRAAYRAAPRTRYRIFIMLIECARSRIRVRSFAE